uniref:Haloacid dehalogenase-like hydrolase n=1 Tax=uncultured bacterium fosmid pJB77G10 TaxID=1478069 RepID=A0A0H3U7S4_9BACT|nr:hypothetical protein [uncultured bacterium fosmid pJB77G10]
MLLTTACSNPSKQLSQWKQDGVIKDIVAYVDDVTNKSSENYIPVEDRIAVFDLDGTLVCEQFPIYYEWILFAERVLNDTSYQASDEMKTLAKEILNAGLNKNIPEDMEAREFIAYGQVFSGMEADTYREYVAKFFEKNADGFDNLKYKDAYFRPMAQLVQYLIDNEFKVFICSGTDRESCRVLVSGFTKIPNYQVIGSDYYSKGEYHGDDYYLNYQYKSNEQVLRGDTGIIKNVKSSKIAQIYQEIGQQPVLAFGNSSGDESMCLAATSGNKYKSAAFIVVPDDDEREYAFPKKVESLKKLCKENGWHTISMKNDFLTIYGDEVVKNPNNKTSSELLLAK